eukprot:1975325-Prymnesium_polylepis.1
MPHSLYNMPTFCVRSTCRGLTTNKLIRPCLNQHPDGRGAPKSPRVQKGATPEVRLPPGRQICRRSGIDDHRPPPCITCGSPRSPRPP